jgi:hypothetical protein
MLENDVEIYATNLANKTKLHKHQYKEIKEKKIKTGIIYLVRKEKN